MKNLALYFFKDEAAATAIEYGLIATGYLGCDHRRSQRSRRETDLDVFIDFDPAQVSESMLRFWSKPLNR
jgi:hypothetical protein